ncbi:pectate lyase-like protein [Arcticibacter tournemirensis]|uniref:Pectate lyase n=1 Tax=Arcticibacter tournemirensis TaxID=699437 RepID=A0A5M9H3C8_9SPHI|nr:pectate lyase [Arcticibacter tournemirensis]KAA8481422.1 pectate lyase [Arcticibacter tournemirensis]TQM49008.1 pectate lyase-like protein [Arcticibacter tournemirensis]
MDLKLTLVLVGGMSLALFFSNCKKSSAHTETKEEVDTPNNPKPTPVNETAIAFPGAEGYGKNTTGGRGGKVIKVTNLNDSGAGSLREAINAVGARIIVFEVSGNIKLKSRLQIKNGDVTIAGQTAPGDGVCIQDYEMNIAANNVIVRFLRFRMGDLTQNEQDALWGRNCEKLIVDHCSMSWSIDECSSFYANKDFTMQYCILSESLNKSFHEKDDHGYGAIWGGRNATFHHNLLAHHNSRNPRFDGGSRSGTGKSPFGTDLVDYRNNVIYNWGSNSAYGGENGQYNIVANYYKPGPGTESSKNRRIMQISMEADLANYPPGYGSFYIAGNYVYGNAAVTADNWNGGVDISSGVVLSNARLSNAVSAEAITQQTAEEAYTRVLSFAGATLKRDAVDTRIVNEVKAGTATYSGSKTGKKGIIDSQTDVGGWPELASGTSPKDSDGDGMPDDWETANKLDPNKSNANGKDLSTGYDNIEVYMNSLVKSIIVEQVK